MWIDRKLVKEITNIRCSFFSRDESKNMRTVGLYIYLSMRNGWVPGLTSDMKNSTVTDFVLEYYTTFCASFTQSKTYSNNKQKHYEIIHFFCEI